MSLGGCTCGTTENCQEGWYCYKDDYNNYKCTEQKNTQAQTDLAGEFDSIVIWSDETYKTRVTAEENRGNLKGLKLAINSIYYLTINHKPNDAILEAKFYDANTEKPLNIQGLLPMGWVAQQEWYLFPFKPSEIGLKEGGFYDVKVIIKSGDDKVITTKTTNIYVNPAGGETCGPAMSGKHNGKSGTCKSQTECKVLKMIRSTEISNTNARCPGDLECCIS